MRRIGGREADVAEPRDADRSRRDVREADARTRPPLDVEGTGARVKFISPPPSSTSPAAVAGARGSARPRRLVVVVAVARRVVDRATSGRGATAAAGTRCGRRRLPADGPLAPAQELERVARARRRRGAQRHRVAVGRASHRRGRDAEVLLLCRAVAEPAEGRRVEVVEVGRRQVLEACCG